MLNAQSHNTKKREHICLPVKRIFPAVKLRPQTPPIDKREIGDAAIPGESRIHTSPSASIHNIYSVIYIIYMLYIYSPFKPLYNIYTHNIYSVMYIYIYMLYIYTHPSSRCTIYILTIYILYSVYYYIMFILFIIIFCYIYIYVIYILTFQAAVQFISLRNFGQGVVCEVLHECPAEDGQGAALGLLVLRPNAGADDARPQVHRVNKQAVIEGGTATDQLVQKFFVNVYGGVN